MALWDKWFDEYPNTDFSQINLDWIIRKLKNHEISIQELFSQDIPTEVQNVLNEWLDDGTLATLINDTLLNQLFGELVVSKTWKVNTFADIQNIDDLAAGDTVTTGGFYTTGDGGSALYKIVTGGGIAISGTGFYAIPVSAKARAWGIVGSGVETNLLQLAIDNSTELDLDDMTITIDDVITLHSTLRLFGNGAIISVQNYTAITDHIITAENMSNISIEGITFDGGTQTADYYMISAVNAINLTLLGCTFRNGIGYRVRISGTENAVVERCQCYSVTGIAGNPGGFLYMQGGHDVRIENIYTEAIQDHVVYLDGSVETYNANITNVRAYNTGISALTNAAVVVAYGNVHDFTVHNVIARDVNEGVGIYERDGENPARYVVTDCDIRAKYNGISVMATKATKGHNANATISNNIINSASQDAFSIRFVRYLMIKGNVISGAGRWGIETTGADDITINANMLRGCAAVGINVGARDSANSTTSNNIFVSNNVIEVDNTVAIYGQNTATDVYSISNTIVGTVGSGAILITYGVSIGNPENGATDIRSIMFGTAAPTVGYHYAGELVIDSTGASDGWRCTVSGAPGTWVAR